MQFADHLYNLISAEIGEYKFKYNKHYIGLENNGIANNFVYFHPAKKSVVLNIRLDKTQDWLRWRRLSEWGRALTISQS